MVADIGANRFPGELRVALHASGLTLESVQRKLAERGFSVGRSTLSYWQNGRRLPTGPTSLLAVHALEDILRLPSGRLTDALADPGGGSATSALDMAAAAARIDSLMAAIGCPDGFAPLESISTLEIGEFGPTGACESLRTVETFRVLADTEHYPVLHGGEPGGDPELMRMELLSGGRIGRVRRDQEANVVIAEAIFDRYLRRGDHHVIHHMSYDGNHQECLLLYRYVLTPRAMMVMDLGFHPDRLPIKIEEFERAAEHGPDLFVRQRTLSPDRRVTMVRERARRGIVGLRWEYA